MNLAKIRQKALNGQTGPATAGASTTVPRQDGAASAASGPQEEQSFIPSDAGYSPPQEPAGAEVAPPAYQHIPPRRRSRDADPLEVILAGREAAGCNDDSPLTFEGESPQAMADNYEEILCFQVSDEIYGINIMELKEIIKPREATEVPRTPSFILGVISLRGVIIPVLDMRDRLGLAKRPQSGRERIVVVKHKEGFAGLLVDEIIQVVRIGKSDFEPAPGVLEGNDRDFVSGIGRNGAMMVILLNVAQIADINLY